MTIKGFDWENKQQCKERQKREYFRQLTSWEDATAAVSQATNKAPYPEVSLGYYSSLSQLLESSDPPTVSSAQNSPTSAQKTQKYNAEQLAAMNAMRLSFWTDSYWLLEQVNKQAILARGSNLKSTQSASVIAALPPRRPAQTKVEIKLAKRRQEQTERKCGKLIQSIYMCVKYEGHQTGSVLVRKLPQVPLLMPPAPLKTTFKRVASYREGRQHTQT